MVQARINLLVQGKQLVFRLDGLFGIVVLVLEAQLNEFAQL